jgi:hypothetical protein
MEVRDCLEQAQQREVEFQEGQWVWLRLLHQPAASMDIKDGGKLGSRFYGPFKILERVGIIAYKLQLLVGARLHDVFHVSVLNRFTGTPPNTLGTLPPLCHGHVCLRPEAVKKSRVTRGAWNCWCIGWTGRQQKQVGWLLTSSTTSTLISSSRTSCWRRGREMSCSACTTPNDMA